jgi:hypothetical protein
MYVFFEGDPEVVVDVSPSPSPTSETAGETSEIVDYSDYLTNINDNLNSLNVLVFALLFVVCFVALSRFISRFFRGFN